MAGGRRVAVFVYYRFDEQKPQVGEEVHCFKSFEKFKRDVKQFERDTGGRGFMRYWEVKGEFVSEDEGDAVVRVVSVREIGL